MQYEDLGIDPKTKAHRKLPLTKAESAFLGVIWVDHVGRPNCISSNQFARRFALAMGVDVHDHATLEWWKRELRRMQNHLIIDHNIPVFSIAGNGGGYWIADDAGEGGQFYDSFKKRGLTGLVKATRGKKSAMVDMVTQLSFEWRGLLESAGMRTEDKDAAAPVEVVDAFLGRMLAEPEKFAGGLRQLGEKYGGVLIPRKRFDELLKVIRSEAARMNELVQELEI